MIIWYRTLFAAKFKKSPIEAIKSEGPFIDKIIPVILKQTTRMVNLRFVIVMMSIVLSKIPTIAPKNMKDWNLSSSFPPSHL